MKDGGRAKLFYKALKDLRAAFYMRKLNIRKWYVQWQPVKLKLEGRGAHDVYPMEMMNTFRRAVVDAKLVPHASKDMWIPQIEKGDEGPIMALLYMSLPNLTLLRIDAGAIAHPCFRTYLQYVLSPASARRLNLKEVMINGWPYVSHKYVDGEVFQSI